MKRKNIRILLSSVLILTLSLSFCFCAGALSVVDSGKCGTGLTWTLYDDGTLAFNGSGEMYDYEDFAPWWSYENEVLTAEVGYGVKNIGLGVFSNCLNLVNVKLPDSLTDIGNFAFLYCYNLSQIILPENLESIGYRAFGSCEKLESITIPESVTVIDDYAFSNCSGLEDITILNSDCGIYDSADTIYHSAVIYGYTNSTAHKYAEKYDRVFVALDGGISGDDSSENEIIASGTCGDNINWILYKNGDLVISGIGEMYEYYYGTETPWNDWRTSVINIVIEHGVTEIGYRAFNGCENLETVTMPDSLIGLGVGVFNGCRRLKEVDIPDSVEWIGVDAFSWCTELKQVKLPKGLTIIGADTFYGCESLSEIILPDSLEYIYGSAFGMCKKITTINIPSKVVEIGIDAFANCTSLESIALPNSLKEIEAGAFFGCDSLKDVYYDGTEKEWNRVLIGEDNEKLLNATIHFKECLHLNKKTEPQVDATCVAIGYTSGVYCPDCEKWLSGHIIIPFSLEHQDNNDDDCCDNCNAELGIKETEPCSCNCHKSGFMGFIWKILNFFQKLFKTNSTCACGVAHY